MRIRIILALLATILIGIPYAPGASVATQFSKITANGPETEFFAAQLFMEIWSESSDPTEPNLGGIPDDHVLFRFHNDNPPGIGIPGSITQIYWSDPFGHLSGTPTPVQWDPLSDFTKFSFRFNSSMGAPPGAKSPLNNIDPIWNDGDTNFRLDSASQGGGVPNNGINQGEIGAFLFKLDTGSTFDDVATSMSNGNLRVAFHAQSIGATANSDTFINANGNLGLIPEPSSGLLSLLGLCLLVRRRRQRTGATLTNSLQSDVLDPQSLRGQGW